MGCILTKKVACRVILIFQFSLNWPEVLLPSAEQVSWWTSQYAVVFFWTFLLNAQPAGMDGLLWTDAPLSSVELSCLYRVTFGFFVASLVNTLLAWSVILVDCPSWTGFLWCHLISVLWWWIYRCSMYEIIILSNIILQTHFDLYLSTTWPVWRAPWPSWLSWSCLLQTGAFQNSCKHIDTFMLRSCDT